ncbi:MAG: hypothetical protein CO189_06110 [candidate division Zixibacteria bacterium CG_4_9_14_3_um_filter_46_8]|nr:MAG: hypothetical protein CO189_06110 [candidate division Zixibacteria bacterium CG_4_9_14_3_um_filter_46_8]
MNPVIKRPWVKTTIIDDERGFDRSFSKGKVKCEAHCSPCGGGIYAERDPHHRGEEERNHDSIFGDN